MPGKKVPIVLEAHVCLTQFPPATMSTCIACVSLFLLVSALVQLVVEDVEANVAPLAPLWRRDVTEAVEDSLELGRFFDDGRWEPSCRELES